MCIAVVEYLIDSTEVDDIVAPDLPAKGFLRDDGVLHARTGDIVAEIAVRAIFGVAGVVEHQPQATYGTVTELQEDRL